MPNTSNGVKYDAIIAGASFAGLNMARVLKGNILLIDSKKEIGASQKSTCCTYYHIIKKLGCEDSILQVIDTGILHIGSKNITSRFHYSLATFDYKKFCQILYRKSNTQFLSAKVRGVNPVRNNISNGVKGDTVITDKGNFQSECIIDATGWRAVLASSIRKDFVPKNGKSFGIETAPFYKNKVIEVWLNPKMMPKGVAWVFPCGEFSRIGIGSYTGKTKIKEGLETFLKKFNLPPTTFQEDSFRAHYTKSGGGLHGGYFTNKFREPTVGNIFVVGDAAGQCLPFSGEGIRPSLYFGEKCGKIIQKVIDEKITRNEGLKEYRQVVLRHKKYYTFFSWAQKISITFPNSWLSYFVKFISLSPIFQYAEKKYVEFANLK